ncbi:uncharacterized protein LOC103523915 [Trichonephila clavipes]|nr:uncharacterized protein LOC103523915 [Trichonephila clavipes]
MVKTMISNFPSHVGIDGNEKKDLLATKGTLEPQGRKPLPPESLKKPIFVKLVDTLKSNQSAKSIVESWLTFKALGQKPVKRLWQTSNRPLLHLSKIGILSTSMCQICNSGFMNADHLICQELDRV